MEVVLYKSFSFHDGVKTHDRTILVEKDNNRRLHNISQF